MATPPFNLDISDPTDATLGNAFPANERIFRDNVNSYINTEHDINTGYHKFQELTTSAKNSLTAPPNGMLVYDTTLPQLQINTGTPGSPVWTPVLPPEGIHGLAMGASGAFTLPSASVKVTGVAAGGGGGGAWTGTGPSPGGNGAPGGWFTVWLTGLTVGNTLTVTIGTGGSGGLGSATAPTGGANGSSTIVASGTQTITTRTAMGGDGGGAAAASTPGAGGMSGGLSTGVAGDLLGEGTNGASNSTNISQTTAYHPYGSGGIGTVGGNGVVGSNGIVFFEWVV